jgi:hypothetical protein
MQYFAHRRLEGFGQFVLIAQQSKDHQHGFARQFIIAVPVLSKDMQQVS